MKLIEAFDLPSRQDITALGFVVKLEEKCAQEKLQKLVDEYVLTPHVRDELPALFEGLHQRFERGEDQGRFIHGSFGSGKSHFMSMLGLLLEDNELAWRKDDPAIRALAQAHRDWVRRANLLVVRVHMLTGGQGGGLDRALYDAVNRTLSLRGKPPFHFLNVEGIFAEARQEARSYGAAFWKQLDQAGIVGSEADFEAIASGTLDEREQLARAYLAFKKRDPASAGLNPNWADGLHKLAAHVKAQGFGGLVFLVDEFLLWLSEKNEAEFKTAINQLNLMVDHTTGQRAVPLFVFVARQRRLREFFPNMVDDEALEEHLDHHKERFETMTLEDVELRHICRHRVLKRRHADEIEKTLKDVVEANEKLLPAILQNGDASYLRDVYPFHPALIETLIDVSTLLQRERTALRLLYELLVVHNPDVELGKFIPVGRAFDALLPESGFDASTRGRQQLSQVHKAWYQRFKPAIERLEVDGQRLSEDRRRTLEALVKTVLLGHLSLRLRGTTGLTVERLVRLNDVEVKGHTDRGRFDRAFNDLRALTREMPALQLSNPDDHKTCVVSVKLEGASLSDVLDAARSRARNKPALLKTYFGHLKRALKLDTRKGVVERSNVELQFPVEWRGTQRRVTVVLGNVRELSDTTFMPAEGEEVRLLIDYPWDDPGFTLEKDRERARAVRRSRGTLPTVCWLPRHFTDSEERTLLDLAATEALRDSAHKDLLLQFSEQDRQELLEQADAHERLLRTQLDVTLVRVYGESGEIESLVGTSSTLKVQETELPAYIDALARAVLDLRFNRHPLLGMEPRPVDLNVLCDWLVRASESTENWLPFSPDEARPLAKLGEPLELVEVGKEKAQLRRDGRFLNVILNATKADAAPWNAIDDTLGGPDFGLQPTVRNFLLAFVARAYSFRVTDANNESIEPVIDKKPLTNLTLRRAQLLAVPEWTRLRTLAREVMGIDSVSPHRTLREHERALRALTDAAKARHEALKGLHLAVQKLRPSEPTRVQELRDALARLSKLLEPSDDPSAALGAWLAAFPNDPNDVIPTVIRTAGEVHKTITDLNASQLELLSNAVSSAAQEHIARLRKAIGTGTLEWRLTPAFAAEWNHRAHEIVQELLAKTIQVVPQDSQPKPPVDTPTVGPRPPDVAPPSQATLSLLKTLRAVDPNAVDDFLEELRAKLTEVGGEVQVNVTVTRSR